VTHRVPFANRNALPLVQDTEALNFTIQTQTIISEIVLRVSLRTAHVRETAAIPWHSVNRTKGHHNHLIFEIAGVWIQHNYIILFRLSGALRVEAVNISISIVIRLAVVDSVPIVAKAPGVTRRSCIFDELSTSLAVIEGIVVNTCTYEQN
jgi:hypothetical protein